LKGIGVANKIVDWYVEMGLSKEEARDKFWFVDSKVRKAIFSVIACMC
jgi:hypothetical protein